MNVGGGLHVLIRGLATRSMVLPVCMGVVMFGVGGVPEMCSEGRSMLAGRHAHRIEAAGQCRSADLDGAVGVIAGSNARSTVVDRAR